LCTLFKYAFLALFFFYSTPLWAQQKTITATFEQYSIANGLPDNRVNCTYQDRDGFLWIGTQSGLSRYDGSSFTNFQHDESDSNSLVNNEVLCIIQDHKGIIWIGTRYGLNHFNPRTGRFKRFPLSATYNKNKLWVGTLFEDDAHRIWVGFNQGMGRINIERDGIEYISFPANPFIQEKEEFPVRAFCKDANGVIWVATQGKGLHRINKQDVPEYIPNAEKMLRNTQECIQADAEGKIWMGTWGSGLRMYNPAKKEWRQYMVQADKKEDDGISNIIRGVEIVYIQGEKKILCATYNAGLYLFDEGKGSFFKIVSSTGKKDFYFTGHSFSAAKDNIFWIATGSNGLIKTMPFNEVAELHSTSHLYRSDETPPDITRVFQPRTGSEFLLSSQWLGSFALEVSSKKGYSFRAFGLPGSKENNTYIYEYLQDGNGNYWLASSNGLVFMKKNTRAARWIWNGQTPMGKPALNCFAIFLDSRGTLWAGTWDGLYYCKNAGAQTTINDFVPLVIKKQEKELGYSTAVKDITEDRYGRIWYTRFWPHDDLPGGISCYNPTDSSYLHYHADGKGAILPPQLNTDQVVIAPDGMMYVRSIGGILQADSKLDKPIFKPLQLIKQLPLNNSDEILCDEENNLWILLQSQLLMINFANNRQEIFTEKNGLPELMSSIDLLRGDKLAIGSKDAFSIVSIAALLRDKKSPQVYITGLSVLNQPYQDSTASFPYISEVRLSHNQNALQINFSLPDFIGGSQIRYRCMLENLDKDWKENGSNNFINYTNIPPGKYVFKVKGTADGRNWSNVAELAIYIKPPFWKTTWFKVLSILTLGVLLFWFYRYRIRRIRSEALLKQQRLEAEMIALRSQMNPHFIFNCMNTIDSYIVTNKPDQASALLQKFSRLIRQVLENSQSALIPLHTEWEILLLYTELEKEVMEYRFDYTATADAALLNGDYKIPALLLQPFVENAILHGLRHLTKKKGHITMNLSLQNDHIIAVIEDNGIGRDAAKRINTQRSVHHQSLGISFAEKRITQLSSGDTMMNRVQVTDVYEAGKPAGTKVTLRIPLIR
jgi:ligand-binding sensor domain-containing protein